jgi:hypothetical protein
MKEYMPNRNWLADSSKLADGLLIYKTILFTFSIGMIFANTTKLLKILINNIQ